MGRQQGWIAIALVAVVGLAGCKPRGGSGTSAIVDGGNNALTFIKVRARLGPSVDLLALHGSKSPKARLMAEILNAPYLALVACSGSNARATVEFMETRENYLLSDGSRRTLVGPVSEGCEVVGDYLWTGAMLEWASTSSNSYFFKQVLYLGTVGSTSAKDPLSVSKALDVWVDGMSSATPAAARRALVNLSSTYNPCAQGADPRASEFFSAIHNGGTCAYKANDIHSLRNQLDAAGEEAYKATMTALAAANPNNGVMDVVGLVSQVKGWEQQGKVGELVLLADTTLKLKALADSYEKFDTPTPVEIPGMMVDQFPDSEGGSLNLQYGFRGRRARPILPGRRSYPVVEPQTYYQYVDTAPPVQYVQQQASTPPAAGTARGSGASYGSARSAQPPLKESSGPSPANPSEQEVPQMFRQRSDGFTFHGWYNGDAIVQFNGSDDQSPFSRRRQFVEHQKRAGATGKMVELAAANKFEFTRDADGRIIGWKETTKPNEQEKSLLNYETERSESANRTPGGETPSALALPPAVPSIVVKAPQETPSTSNDTPTEAQAQATAPAQSASEGEATSDIDPPGVSDAKRIVSAMSDKEKVLREKIDALGRERNEVQREVSMLEVTLHAIRENNRKFSYVWWSRVVDDERVNADPRYKEAIGRYSKALARMTDIRRRTESMVSEVASLRAKREGLDQAIAVAQFKSTSVAYPGLDEIRREFQAQTADGDAPDSGQ